MSIFSATVVPLNDAPVVFLSSEKGVKFWHIHSPELPVAAQTIELKRLDAAFLEKKPSFAAIKASKRVAIKKIAALFAKLTTVSVLCKNVDDASKSFVIQITLGATAATSTSAKNPPTWTDIRIYSSKETIQPYLFAVIKACGIPQTSFLKKAFIGTAGFAAVGFAFAIKAMEPAKSRRGAGLPPAFPNSSRANNDGDRIAGSDAPPAVHVVSPRTFSPINPNPTESFAWRVSSGSVTAYEVKTELEKKLQGRDIRVSYLPSRSISLDSLNAFLAELERGQGNGAFVIGLSSLCVVQPGFNNKVTCTRTGIFGLLLDSADRIKQANCKIVLVGDVEMDAYCEHVDARAAFVKTQIPELIKSFNRNGVLGQPEKQYLYCWSNLRNQRDNRGDLSILLDEIMDDLVAFVTWQEPAAIDGVRECSVCCNEVEGLVTTGCCKARLGTECQGHQIQALCRACMEKSLALSVWRKCPTVSCQRFNATIVPV